MRKIFLFATFIFLISLGLPFLAHAYSVSELDNPVGFSSLGQILTKALPIIYSLVGFLAVIVFSIGAFRYMVSRGDPKAVDGARNTMTGAIIGFVIVLGVASFSGVFQYFLGLGLFGTNQTGKAPDANGSVDLACAFRLTTGKCIGEQFKSFGELTSWILLMILSLAGLVFFFMLVWGGIRYMLARGDEKAINDARSTLTNTFVGLLLIISGLVIIRLISTVVFQSGNLIF